MPLQETSGNLTTDAFGGGVAAVVPAYIEDWFSTYLYTGTATTLSINNGLDLSTKGGLVWLKSRSYAGSNNWLINTANGVNSGISSNTASAAASTDFSSFNTNGFTLGNDVQGGYNNSGATFVSWSFVKKPKFFTIATWTGTGSAQNITHDLGSIPGCILVKKTSSGGVAWAVYHNGFNGGTTPEQYYAVLNTTAAQTASSAYWNNTAPTGTQFTVGTSTSVNASGASYTAFIFASNAGGFGLTGTDNVISCGSFTQGSGDTAVTLGYEPQWVMIKQIDTAGSWDMSDNMRGMPVSGSATKTLDADLSNAESSSIYGLHTTATGFVSNGYTSGTFIYIAIRRGPMKVPTDATKVFAPITGNDNTTLTTGFPVDMFIDNLRTGNSYNSQLASRLTGNTNSLQTSSTSAELTSLISNPAVWQSNTSFQPSIFYSANGVNFAFQRAPSFFDEVCYTGTGSARTISHNLGVIPELYIHKRRNEVSEWDTGSIYLSGPAYYLTLYTTSAQTNAAGGGLWNNTFPTSSVITVGSDGGTNGAGYTYVAYLFATCAGVSKVGTYTGNGTTQTIDCGFTGGARFVLIKCTSATGGWYVYDTARGMTTLTDPYLQLNSTAAETATLGSVTTVSTGFAVNATILAAINTSSATYIFLAIA